MITKNADHQLKPNHIYRMVSGKPGCVGCILRVNPHSKNSGITIRAACGDEGYCSIRVALETWEEISEEQAMEAMLGG